MSGQLNIEYFRAELLRLRDELKATRSTRDASAATVKLDQASVGRLSRMDALQQQAMALNTRQRTEQTLRQIDAALRRCEEGSFGYCLECDEPIAKARLELNPSVTLCITCAEAHDR